jgi:hypothetical protein
MAALFVEKSNPGLPERRIAAKENKSCLSF